MKGCLMFVLRYYYHKQCCFVSHENKESHEQNTVNIKEPLSSLYNILYSVYCGGEKKKNQ